VNIADCRDFVAARQTAAISNARRCAPICSDLGTSAQKCPKSGAAVRSGQESTGGSIILVVRFVFI